MRYALISDVHANLPALRAALDALAGARADGFLCAGDLVGYGPHPNECVELLQRIGALCVAGNHDLMAIDRLPLDRADALARTTLAWTRDRLDPATRNYLAALPLIARVQEVAIAHGSLHDPQEYVSDPAGARREIAALARLHPDAALLLLGHTHRPAAYGESGGRLHRRGDAVHRPDGERWLINPGSIGQARELRPLVRFAVFDTDRGEARFHGVRYDVERTRRDLVAAGLPPDAAHRRPRLRSKLRRGLTRVLGGC